MKTRILVIGGTGLMGRPVSYALKEAGHTVRILTRDVQKGKRLFNDSFEIIAGNPADPGSLGRALKDSSGVHISLPTEVEQQVAEGVAQSASGSGVKRISYISGATVAEENRWFPMINRKFIAEKALRESGVPSTIFCPTWVMESLPLFVRGGRASVLGKQPCPYHWVAADDLARMVAASYGCGEAANNRFLVFGPQAIFMREALKRYCAVFHPEIRTVSAMPFWILDALAAVTRNRELKKAVDMMSYFEKIGEGKNPAVETRILGAPSTTLDMWLEKRQSARDK